MATSYRNISANELADNLGKSVPTQGYITFPNGKKALVGITPLGSVDIRREMQSSYGLISIGTKVPMWLEEPRLIDAQSAQEVTNFSWLSFTSSLNSAAGVGVGVAELSGYSATMRFTRQNGTIFSPKVYTNGWRGGSTSRITTYKVTSVAGRILFYTGVALDVEKSVAGEQSWAKTTMNITFSAVAAFAGPDTTD